MDRYRAVTQELPILPKEPSTLRILLRSLFWGILSGLPGLFITLMITYILMRIATPRLEDIIIPQDLYNDWLRISFILRIPHHYIPYLVGGIIILLGLTKAIFSIKERLRHPPKYPSKYIKKLVISILLCMGIGFLFLPFGFGLFENTIQLLFGLGEVTLKGWMYIGLSLIATLSIPAAIFGMFLFGMINLKRENYLAYLILPFLLTISFIAGCLSFYRFASKYNYGEYFWERLKIPVISEQKERYVLIFMEEDVECKKIKVGFKVTPFEKKILSLTPYFKIEPPAKGKLTIDASLESVQKAHNYLKERDYRVWSFFGELVDFVVMGYSKNWSLKETSKFQFETFKNSNYIIGGMVLIHNLSKFAKFDQEFLDLIDGLANESLFHHGKMGSKKLGDTYLHFGEYKKAKYWYDKAKGLGYNKKEDPIPEIDFTKPFFKEGKIQGKILIDGRGFQEVRVGLLRPPKEGEEINLDSYISPIVASTATDKEGRFSFDDILEGEYYLAIMTDRHLESDERIGKLSLLSKTPAVNLGIIRIHSLRSNRTCAN